MVLTDRPVIILGHGIVFVNPMKKAKKKLLLNIHHQVGAKQKKDPVGHPC